MIALVTDSTSDLNAEDAEKFGIRIVPLTVRFGEEEYRDGVDIDAPTFYKRLTSTEDLPSTSQPSPEAFIQCYRELFDGGATEVVSVHISSKLSGTYQSALLASQGFARRVHVVDTLSVSAGMQFPLIAAREAIAAGKGVSDVVAAAESVAHRGGLYVLVNTLTYLQKGGRVGRAQALVGGLLNVKPIVQLRDGVVHPESRVRSRAQGLDRLVDLLTQVGQLESVGIMHAAAPELLDDLAPRVLSMGLVGTADVRTGELGPVVGTYSGPGAIGVVYVRKEPNTAV